MNDIGEHPNESIEPVQSLKERIYRSIIEDRYEDRRLTYLSEKGYIPRSTPEALSSWIDGVFESHSEENFYEREDVRELLLVSGLIEYVTALDWSVDRTSECEAALGLQPSGFKHLEGTLGNFLKENGVEDAEAVHLHKGFGNGKLMESLSGGRKKRNRVHWTEAGIADRYYSLIEDVVQGFLREQSGSGHESFRRHLFPILSLILRRALRNTWFINRRRNKNDWEMDVPFFDLNDINRITTSDIRHAISQLHDPDTGFLKQAIMFEDEGEEFLEHGLHALLLRLQGFSVEEMEHELLRRNERKLKSVRKSFGRKIAELYRLRKDILIKGPEKRAEQIEKFEQLTASKKVQEDTKPEVFIDRVEEEIATLQEARESVSGLTSDGEKSHGGILDDASRKRVLAGIPEDLDVFDEDLSLARMLDTYFKEGIFCTCRSQNIPEGQDLNRQAVIRTENTQIGYFTEIPQRYDPESVHLITGIRSDSHENDQAFIDDIRGCLQTLSPGGVCLIDGNLGSYNDIQRFDLIWELVEEIEGVDAKAVVDKKTLEPVSVFIQKGVPTQQGEGGFSYLSDKEKENFLSESCMMVPLETVMDNPIVTIMNDVRRGMLRFAGGSNEIFSECRGKLERFGHAKIVRACTDALLRLEEEGLTTPLRDVIQGGGGAHVLLRNAGKPAEVTKISTGMEEAVLLAIGYPRFVDAIALLDIKFKGNDGAQELVDAIERCAKTGRWKSLFYALESLIPEMPIRSAIQKRPGFFHAYFAQKGEKTPDQTYAMFLDSEKGIFKSSLSFAEVLEIIEKIEASTKKTPDIFDQMASILEPPIKDIRIAKRAVWGLLAQPHSDTVNWILLRSDFFWEYARLRKKRSAEKIEKSHLYAFYARIEPSEMDAHVVQTIAVTRVEDILSRDEMTEVGSEVEAYAYGLARGGYAALIGREPPETIFNTFISLDPGKLYSFPDTSLQKSVFNDHRTHRGNRPIWTPPSLNRGINRSDLTSFSSDREQLIAGLRSMQDKVESPFYAPLMILSLADCPTHGFLQDRIGDILGEQAYAQLVDVCHVSFSGRGDSETTEIVSLEGVLAQLHNHLQEGGIVVSGGNFLGMDDPRGGVFKNEIMHRILHALKTNKNFRFLGIGSSHQALIDCAGKDMFEGDMFVEKGALEVGAIDVLPEGITPFEGPISLSFAHTGHVNIRRVSTERFGPQTLYPHTWSGLTNLPVAFGGFNGRLHTCEFHPQIPTDDPEGAIPQLLESLNGTDTTLKTRFGIAPHMLSRQFQSAETSAGDKTHPYDMGTNVLARLLKDLVCSDGVQGEMPKGDLWMRGPTQALVQSVLAHSEAGD